MSVTSVDLSDALTITFFFFLLAFLQAYSVYDEEIGYCQGQSFLAAVLLLHVSKLAMTFINRLSCLFLV